VLANVTKRVPDSVSSSYPTLDEGLGRRARVRGNRPSRSVHNDQTVRMIFPPLFPLGPVSQQ
jgi:hypothetical protein